MQSLAENFVSAAGSTGRSSPIAQLRSAVATVRKPVPVWTALVAGVTVNFSDSSTKGLLMSAEELNRRQFTALSSVALGGLLAGASIGCGPKAKPVAAAAGDDKHLCRGLNDCESKGGDGKNACRGQGTCATVAHHECGTHNTCKGLGGCGPNPAMNDCAGKGGCGVPLMPGAWETVRKRMEEKWTTAQQKFAAAPEEKK